LEDELNIFTDLITMSVYQVIIRECTIIFWLELHLLK
jgi:hypothetical protein